MKVMEILGNINTLPFPHKKIFWGKPWYSLWIDRLHFSNLAFITVRLSDSSLTTIRFMHAADYAD